MARAKKKALPSWEDKARETIYPFVIVEVERNNLGIMANWESVGGGYVEEKEARDDASEKARETGKTWAVLRYAFVYEAPQTTGEYEV